MCKPFKEFVRSGHASLKLIISLTFIVVGVEVIIAILIWFSGDWFLGGSRQTFGPLHNYVFIWLSIVIASTAALNAAIASFVASRSLELTRATIRPFLNVINVVYQPPKTVELTICNTGALPPDSSNYLVVFSETNDFSNNIGISDEFPPIFPNEKEALDIYLVQDKAEYVNSGNEVYMKIEIHYIYHGKEEGMTSRVSYLPKSDKGRRRVPFSILSEGSSWK